MSAISDKIKIMHLVSHIGYDGPSRGVLGQVKYTDKNRFHNIICEIKSSKHAEVVKYIGDMGCEHVALGKKSYDISAIYSIVKLLKNKRIDILNTHNAIPCWYGNIAAKIARVRVVFTLRNLQSENYKFILKKKMFYGPAIFIDNMTMNFADKIVAVSERLKDYYVDNTKISGDKITAIGNAIDLEQIEICNKKQIKKDMGIGQNDVLVGIVGDIVKRKGHMCLVDAAKTIVENCQNVRFLIVGDGDMRHDVIERIERYNISKYFIFTGHVKNVYPLLSIMDMFVLPSFAEGISRALMESMAVGIPSVCSAIDGNLEAVVDGETGFIFAPNDHISLAQKLKILISDENKRKYMGENARNRAKEKFDIKNLAGKYENLYLQLLKME